MTSLNRQRANIIFSALFDSDPDVKVNPESTQHQTGQLQDIDMDNNKAKKKSQSIKFSTLTPAQVANQESIFARDGLLTWNSTRLGTCRIGAPLHILLEGEWGKRGISFTGSGNTDTPLKEVLWLFRDEPYLLFFHFRNNSSSLVSSTKKQTNATIILKRGCSVRAQIKSWAHALLAARILNAPAQLYLNNLSSSHSFTTIPPKSNDCSHSFIIQTLTNTLNILNNESRFERYEQALGMAGWDLELAALETSPGRRVQVDNDE